MSFAPEPDPHHNPNCRSCKDCGEPRVEGFIHVCFLSRETDIEVLKLRLKKLENDKKELLNLLGDEKPNYLQVEILKNLDNFIDKYKQRLES